MFTKEIQNALLAEAVDVAVHSLKDLPTTKIEGLILAAVPERGPTFDVFVSRRFPRFDDLPPGAVLATSSLRRRAQVLHHRPDLKLIDIRGNVDTRLRKLDEQGLDGILLAQAGLVRLGRAAEITEILDAAWMLPAVGQGALGLECRIADTDTHTLLQHLNDRSTYRAVLAERALLRGLGGGCQVPIGANTRIAGEHLVLQGVVLPPDGSSRVASSLDGPASESEDVGKRLAEILWKQGARQLLDQGHN